MGIVNVTPDSFHEASRVGSVAGAVEAALKMWDDGADWVDVGGESTRPGAEPVAVAEELERVIPVIQALNDEREKRQTDSTQLISVDTRRVEVAKAALDTGADMVNDVSGLRDPKMGSLVVERGCAVCIMHMLGEPGNMQSEPEYADVVSEVSENLLGVATELVNNGHPPELICLDPGIGFGKRLSHNLELLRENSLTRDPRFPLLWGVSRKSMFNELLGRESTDDRLPGTLAVAAHSMAVGVDILRVHDVAEHHDLLTTLSALKGE
jgi:dihydropteroate synthase